MTYLKTNNSHKESIRYPDEDSRKECGEKTGRQKVVLPVKRKIEDKETKA